MTYLFYDLETFGINPQLDRIAQFACVRTNNSLEIVEEPVVLYCKVSEDYLPDIEACLLTGITPVDTEQKGLCEHEFIHQINGILGVPGTCVLGYNSIRFDDEFIRNALYRNFFDPYRREWADGNSRWDLIDMVRLTHDLRPGNIKWPLTEEHRPSFKLADLAKENQLSGGESHDALADVYHTIALARLIFQNNPKLFNYCYEHRDKSAVSALLSQKEILVHTSRILASEHGCTSLVIPLMEHPTRKNYVLSYDLRYDPKDLIDLPVKEVEELIFADKENPRYAHRIHLKGIHLNKCPILAPVSVLDRESYERLHISRETCETHFQKLLDAETSVMKKLSQIYEKESFNKSTDNDPDTQIYSGGFFSPSDRFQLTRVHEATSDTISELTLKTKDPRIPHMFFRWKGRNYPEALSVADKISWKAFCEERRHTILASRQKTMADYKDQLNKALRDEKFKPIAEKLFQYMTNANIVLE
ncbi:MAG: exodeoxyribonuclease I [Candidatus Margulisiibacteriota bacterium]